MELMVRDEQNLKNFPDRLRKAAGDAGIPSFGMAAQLARIAGVTSKAAQKWLAGDSRPSTEKMVKIAETLMVRVEWLAWGTGPIVHIRNGVMVEEEANIGPAPANRGNIPLISWVQAGSFQEATEAYAPGMAEQYLPCPVPHSTWTFALRVRGESMFNPHGGKSFGEGDIIYVDPEVEAINKSFVIVKLVDAQEATFKQLVIDGSLRYLKAINPSWPEPYLEINSDAVIQGVVIAKLEKV